MTDFSFSLQMTFDELGVGEQPLVHANHKKSRVSRWIVDGYVDLQRAKGGWRKRSVILARPVNGLP